MRLSRLTLAVMVALALAAGVAVAALLVVVTGGDDDGRDPGRVAVIGGCGLVTMERDGTDEGRLCLPGIWAAVSVAADGSALAWDTESGSRSGIFLAGIHGEDRRRVPLPSPGANFEPSLAPDGERLAFLHSPLDDGRYDVWTASTSGEGLKRLTTSRNVSAVAWSPADDMIAYVSGWSPETLEGDIVFVEPSGENRRILTRGDEPAWAPDGERLAFVRTGSVWTVNADGTDLRPVVRNARAPAWSRDGRLLALMRPAICRNPPCDERAVVVSSSGGSETAVGPTFPDTARLLWLPADE